MSFFIQTSLCFVELVERLRLPPGPAHGGGDARRLLHHGSAVVRSSHRLVHLPREQPEAGVRELGSRRTASVFGNPRTEADGPGHLPADGLFCLHDWSAAGWSRLGLSYLISRVKHEVGYCLLTVISVFRLHFCCSLFQFIPMPVLYGVFLYMGASSLKGIQVTHHLEELHSMFEPKHYILHYNNIIIFYI